MTAPVEVAPATEAASSAPVGVRRRESRRAPARISVLVWVGFVVLLALLAAFAPLVATHPPNTQDVLASFQGPSSDHWLGTDDLGRDLFSRLAHGARVSLLSSIAVVGISLVLAVPLGLFSGYRGGWPDNVLMRVIDAGLSIPPLVLALAVSGILGPGVVNVVIALVIVFFPGFVRLVRGASLAVREETFIEASRSIGSPTWRILVRRVLPNVRSPLIVQCTLALGSAMLAEAGLSYLGLGLQPPDATWGNMLRRAYDTALFTDSFQLVIPGAAIALTVLAFTVIGEGLRDQFGGSGGRTLSGRQHYGLTMVTRDEPQLELPPADRDRGSARAPLLDVRGLSVEFQTPSGVRRVVDDVSFSVGAGEIVGLVGESGSGKSVTSLSLMRLVPSPPGRIVAGTIDFNGRNVLTSAFKELRAMRGAEMSMVFQDPMSSLDPRFTVGNQLVEAQRLHGRVRRTAARRRAAELLELVGIPSPNERLGAYPHQLSGGMRQRAMIALALVNQPKLLIADEPTTALDVTVQAQILDLLRSIRDEFGTGILFVTHDLGVVADVCDRVVVMYAGEIVEQSTVWEMFSRPAHPYTEGLLGAMPQEGRRVDRLTVIPGQVPSPGELPRGCRFQDRCPYVRDECRNFDIELSAIGAHEQVRCQRASELELKGSR